MLVLGLVVREVKGMVMGMDMGVAGVSVLALVVTVATVETVVMGAEIVG